MCTMFDVGVFVGVRVASGVEMSRVLSADVTGVCSDLAISVAAACIVSVAARGASVVAGFAVHADGSELDRMIRMTHL